MFKFLDNESMIRKKITRNNIIIDLYRLYKELNDEEIKGKQLINDFYLSEITKVQEINEIELKQLTDYTKEREDKSNELINELNNGLDNGLNNTNIEIVSIPKIREKIETIKNEIRYKNDVLHYIQSLIPTEGEMNQYTIRPNLNEN